VLAAPNPTSSNKTINTFGAPPGGNNGSIGGNPVSGSLASYVVNPGAGRSGIGNIVRACRSGLISVLRVIGWFGTSAVSIAACSSRRAIVVTFARVIAGI
jgi:hypothetical protein